MTENSDGDFFKGFDIQRNSSPDLGVFIMGRQRWRKTGRTRHHKVLGRQLFPQQITRPEPTRNAQPPRQSGNAN
jgi:hypothetical protein